VRREEVVERARRRSTRVLCVDDLVYEGADVLLVNRSYLRGITQVDRRTVDAARALLGIPPREAD
jgi:hypothetical protein